MPGLESLLIEGWQRPLLDDTGIAALARARLPGLRTLWLRDLATTAATFEHIATSTFDRLEELAIQGYFETGPAALARSSNFAYLHTLDLGRNRLAGAELAALARSSAFPALHTLDLALNRITDAGILALAAGAGMPELASLDLGYATLSAGAVRVYANASRFAKLRKLSLRGVARGPEVAIAIAESPHATNLRELDLSGCKGRDEAAFAVARSPHLAGITTLAFGKNKVTHAGRQALVDRFGDRVTLDR